MVMLSNKARLLENQNQTRVRVIANSSGFNSPRSRPSNDTAPAVGRIKPMIVFSKTVFPHPLSPMMASVCPRGTSKLILRNTPCCPKRTSRPRQSDQGLRVVIS